MILKIILKAEGGLNKSLIKVINNSQIEISKTEKENIFDLV